jgi:protein-S-isoprenylcysteine O-methyltransferase Ste14
MLCQLIAFWATPRMSVGHLVFAAGMTLYILVGIAFEERDLLAEYGESYAKYRAEVARLAPLRWRR